MTSKPLILQDFEPYLKKKVPGTWWEYFQRGADAQQTLADNVLAFQKYRLRPRCLRDVSKRDLSTTILGHRLDFPVGVCPTAFQGMVHPEGDVAMAKGVASVGSAMALSIYSSNDLEDVTAPLSSEIPLFQQLNVFCDRQTLERTVEYTKHIIKRAEKAGLKGIVLTVDQPVRGRRLAEPIFIPPYIKCPLISLPNDPHFHSKNLSFDASMTWDDIEWLRSMTSLPIILKGILTAEDAKEAVRRGASAIWVSNHGGRQLDGVSASIDALPEVVDAVRGSDIEVYLDGGIRQGTDVLKALALGARAVFIGRPALWGLAYDGAAGVTQVLEILRDELSRAMALSGCASVADITSDLVKMPSHGV
ncbi:hydroxyacid oxidase 1-like isoform X2 [Acanthaster planci]|uniref:(S)-2-hydroxy-acid oxidase n=1 Tax=Acanthaster planci TaxID=133434 RepID=A0A8B7Z429_ACAPL|nr:hydroxyacid oxidase 1-like isoform X2 [Acanthaster planci]